MMKDNPKLVYSPLPSDKASFRLLKVFPTYLYANPETPLQCSLTNAPMERFAKQYVAGSYVWGPPGPVRLIVVNGYSVYIRENLERFLRACRRKWRVFTLWVDAICINQDDLAERGSQVRMMDRIYRNAKSVYCWLGSEPKVTAALGEVNSLGKSGRTAKHIARMSVNHIQSAISTLLACEYWTRVWIVQEFVLAHQTYLLAGQYKTPSLWLVNISDNLNKARWTSPQREIARRIRELQLSQRQESDPHSELEAAFGIFGPMRCALPQDRIFALIGILDPRSAALLRPLISYETSLWTLLCEILEAGVVRNYPRFVQQYTTDVLERERHRLPTKQIELFFNHYLTIRKHSLAECTKAHPWHYHECRWFNPPKGVDVSCRILDYLNNSFDLCSLLHRDLKIWKLRICALIKPCALDCNPRCQGHPISGLALILESLSDLGKNTLHWAYTLDSDFTELESDIEFRMGAQSTLRWEGRKTTVSDALRTFQNVIMATRSSKDGKMPYRSTSVDFILKTDLATFVRLCDFVMAIDRDFQRAHPQSVIG